MIHDLSLGFLTDVEDLDGMNITILQSIGIGQLRCVKTPGI
jgi:hypothetical protein